MKPQRIEAQRVLWIVLPPFVIGYVTQRLQRIVVASSETAIDEAPGCAHRVTGAEIDALQNSAHDAFAGNRILSYELPVAGQHAAEILRPRAVDGAVDDDMADLAGAKFLRHRRQTEAGVDLAVCKQFSRRWR